MGGLTYKEVMDNARDAGKAALFPVNAIPMQELCKKNGHAEMCRAIARKHLYRISQTLRPAS